MSNTTKIMAVRVTHEWHKRLQYASVEMHRSMASIVIEAVDEYLERNKERLLGMTVEQAIAHLDSLAIGERAICAERSEMWLVEAGSAEVTNEGTVCTTEGFIDATLSSLRRRAEVSGVDYDVAYKLVRLDDGSVHKIIWGWVAR